MGCDGGTIPTRDELVRTKKKPEQKDKTADLAARWKHCAITQEPLQQPIMACELGRLYKKESILEFLIDRSKFECATSFEHLRGLKDLKELKLTENSAFHKPKADTGDGYTDSHISEYICPVSGLEMNGRYKFCVLWKCGCVLSEKALKEVKGSTCHKCGKSFTETEIIGLNGTEEEVEELRSMMEQKRLQAKLDKKAKKEKKHKLETVTQDTDGPSTSKQSKADEASGTSKMMNGHAEQRSKLSSKLSKKSVVSSETTTENPGSSRGVQNDPKSSTVYKSLFTSCKEAKNQVKPHWITYNPGYY